MAAYVRCSLLCGTQGRGGVMVEMLLTNGGGAGCGRYRIHFFARSRCHAVLLSLNNP